MKNRRQAANKYSVTIVTTIVMAIAFCYYLFIYIPGQEDNIKERNFRVLDKITRNINENLESFRKKAQLAIRTNAEYALKIIRYKDKLKRNSDPEFKKRVDDYVDFLERRILTPANIEERYGVNIVYMDSLRGETSRVYSTAYEELKRVHPLLLQEKYVPQDNRLKEVRYMFTLDVKALVEPHIRKDVFKHYALFNEKDILFSTFSSGLKIGNVDTLLQSENGILSSTVRTVRISGKEYQAFIHPVQIGEDHFILCGFIPYSEYRKEKMSLESNVVLFSLLLLFIIILGFPFYKFALMNTSERINIPDVLFASGSLVLGASMLVLLFLGLNNYWGSDRSASETELKDMSSLLSGSFVNEIDSAYEQLCRYDTLITKIGFDATNIGTDPQLHSDDPEMDQDRADSLKKDPALLRSMHPRSYPDVKTVFWTNAEGEQVFKWTTEDELTEKVPVRDRMYFKSISEGNTWVLPQKKGSIAFDLESVYSSTTGKITTAISKKSGQSIVLKNNAGDTIDIIKTSVIALTTDMNSVVDPVLPLGFGYCIINESGDVLFHSDRSRNLKENLVEECTSKKELESSIYGRIPLYFKEKYQGKYYRMFIRPISNLPLFIVTFQENDYEKTKDAETLSFTLTLILSYFLFICFLVLVMMIISRKRSKLKTQRFPFEWLWPRESRKENYFTALLFQVTLILLVFIFSDQERPLYSFFIFLLTSVYALFITDLLIKRYTVHRFFQKKETWSFNLFCAFIVIFLNAAAAEKLDSISSLIGFQLCLLLSVPLIIGFKRLMHRMNRLPAFIRLPHYRSSYVLLMLSWLTITSILPSWIFYGISHRQEQQFLVRHRQLDIAKQVNLRSDLDTSRHYLTAGKDDHIYISFFSHSRILKKFALPHTDNDHALEGELFSKLISIVRPSFNDISAANSSLVGGSAADGTWRWAVTGDEVILQFNDVLRSNNRDVDSLFIVSEKNASPGGAASVFFRYALFLLILWTFLFFLIRFTVRKAFLVDLFTNKDLLRLENALLNDPEVNRNLFIVGLPSSTKSRYVDARFEGGAQRYTIDVVCAKDEEEWQRQVRNACEDKNKLIILDHFEYNAEDPDTNRKKLVLAEKLMQFPDKRVVIISTMHPWILLQQGKTKKQDDICDADRWTKLLGGFIKIYYPLQGYGNGTGDPEKKRTLVEKECDHGVFLRSLKPVIEKHIADKMAAGIRVDREEIILSIQSMAYTYYHSLWASFKKEERYLIFDLAQDGLANSRNIDIIAGLIKSGVLIYDGSLKVMNESFRNFVLTEIRPEEVLSLETEANENGYWNQFKKPLVVILVLVGLFIFATQQESYNNLITLIASFTAGIPILLRVLSIFNTAGAIDPKKSKEA